MINFEETVFDLAYKGALDDVKSRISGDPGLTTAKDGNDRLLIHWAALGGYEPLVAYLIEHKSPVDPPDDIGMTPLILAASANRLDVVRLLIENGANVNAQNNEGHSALQYSASKGWKQIMALLIDNGADVNITDKRKATPLHRAASRGDVSVASLMFELAKDRIMINATDVYGNAPLHLACEEGNLPMAEILIQNGALTDIENRDKKTPIELASPAAQKTLAPLMGLV